MGLQNQPSLAKDSQEMEQILVDLGNTDLVQSDLLQAIKTLETGADALSTGDAEAIFPLSGFDLPDAADSEGDAVDDKIKLSQARLERRCAFLQRRLRILQARTIGKRVSEEATVTFEKCTRGARRDGGGRPVGLKTFLKTVETTSALQASAASRTVVGPQYYNPGTSRGDASKSASVGVASGTLTGLEDTAGALHAHLSLVKQELDSDATASSSGAESNDEAVSYNNPHQQPMPIEKRALWTWHRTRATIAFRWSWLQAQVQELEYKIRQHNELHHQVREAKGPVQFEGEPVAYEGILPGADTPDDDRSLQTCARVRPLRRETFKKRKLLQMHNLHMATNKAKPSDIRCSCMYPTDTCSVCTGRAEPTQPELPFSTLSKQQRLASVDPSYHPVLSDIKDLSPALHMAALTSRNWFRMRLSKAWRGAHHGTTSRASAASTSTGTATNSSTPRSRGHTTRLKRGRPPLSRKNKERERDDESSTSGKERPRGRPSTESRSWRRQSYDIDNIVIPQSIAANTRPQILTYKEIITPKWRIVDLPETSMNNGVVKSTRMSTESEEEDVSDSAVQLRHTRAEGRERERYVRKRRARRDQQQQEELTTAPALPSLPPPPPPPRIVSPPDTPVMHETVRPYTPRQFPLEDDQYQDMLSIMPDGYRPSSPEPTPPPEMMVDIEEDDGSSTLSPMSPVGVFDGDDPDDAEWDPNSERSERRKSSFR